MSDEQRYYDWFSGSDWNDFSGEQWNDLLPAPTGRFIVDVADMTAAGAVAQQITEHNNVGTE